ncbi:MAG: 50S ribosomal protein L4 [Myxococcales bacterium]|nr:50S ribosomal protein L4 [Myxococcales bacterium]
MPKMNILNTQAQVVGELDLDDEVFGAEVKPHLHWEMVRNQLANRRQGTHSTKTRSTVHGTTRKTYKQKGSGNARHGSRKAPIFVHGGIAHGPHPRDYSYTMPRQARRAALCSALSLRFANGELIVVDAMAMALPKTKEAAATLARLGASNALIVTRNEEGALHKSIRNLPSAKYIRAEGVNVYDVLKYDRLVLTVDGVKALEERLA